MSTNTDAIFIEALSLSEQERASLMQKLLLSFEPEEGSFEIEAACKFEALDRCQAFAAGLLTERSAADVMNDSRQKLKQRSGAHQ